MKNWLVDRKMPIQCSKFPFPKTRFAIDFCIFFSLAPYGGEKCICCSTRLSTDTEIPFDLFFFSSPNQKKLKKIQPQQMIADEQTRRVYLNINKNVAYEYVTLCYLLAINWIQ